MHLCFYECIYCYECHARLLHTHTLTHIHTHTHTHTHTHIHTHTHTHTHTHASGARNVASRLLSLPQASWIILRRPVQVRFKKASAWIVIQKGFFFLGLRDTIPRKCIVAANKLTHTHSHSYKYIHTQYSHVQAHTRAHTHKHTHTHTHIPLTGGSTCYLLGTSMDRPLCFG